jgi:3-carboxy-cis,cis-muconate cycloisomerase
MHHAMIQEHERGTHGWQVEWLTLSQMILLTAGALKNALFLAENLKIDAGAMRANIARSNDLVLAEAAVQALSAEISRTQARDLVKQACATAAAEDRSLVEVVKQQYVRGAPQNHIDWEALAKPENYLGQSQLFIDRVLDLAKQQQDE